MLNGLFEAIRFITILPLGRPEIFRPKAMIPFFPLVGLFIGLILFLADAFFSLLWAPPIAALLDVVLLLVLTGAFHADGLGDTADGLFSHKNREEALRIMKDSRVGVMGLVAIVSMVFLKWGGIWGLHPHRGMVLFLVPAYARAGMLFGIRFLPYGRPAGKGRDFFAEPMTISDFWGLGVVMMLSCLLGWFAIWFNGAFFLITAGIVLFYRKKMACITGDMLGAMSETLETALFLLAAAEVFA